MLALHHVDLILPDCGNIGQSLVGQQARFELLGAECDGLGIIMTWGSMAMTPSRLVI